MVSVIDTGIGISADIKPLLFTKFMKKQIKGQVLGCISPRVLSMHMVAGCGLKIISTGKEQLLDLVYR